jgi:hypothetical protein
MEHIFLESKLTVDFLAGRHLERFWATRTGKRPLKFEQHLLKKIIGAELC